MKIFKGLHKYMNKPLPSNAQKDFFRSLTYLEKHAVEVFDFRDIQSGNPNNKVMITCEHATNKTHNYIFPKDEQHWLDTHWGYDIGAKDMGIELSESSKILSVYSNFSRLLIDPNRSLISDTLVRKKVEKNIELFLNKDENVDREKRINMFYMPYYKVLWEALDFVKPRYLISSHSFTKQYEDHDERKYEVGILFREKSLLSDLIESEYKREGVNYRINEPYHPNEGVCHAMDCISTYKWPDWYTQVVLLEFRNDYCSDTKWRKKQVDMLTKVVEYLNDH